MGAADKGEVLGVGVARTDYARAIDAIVAAARQPRSFRVTCAAVHLLMEAHDDARLADALRSFDLVLPDGQPVRWALAAEAALLPDRVYGPELMRRLVQRAAREELPVYLYGAGPRTIDALGPALGRLAPGLVVAGAQSPPFGDALWRDGPAACAAIRQSGARILFVGLGCPKQERWIARFGGEVGIPSVAVGAAFDLLAGQKRMAPAWMQRAGLEWLWRASTEPRTWRRYLLHNPRFAALAGLEAARRLSGRRGPARPPGS